MGMQPTTGPVVIRAGDVFGRSLGSSGRGRLKILSQRPAETGYALIEASHPIGQPVIRDHVHATHDETFVVVDGQYQIRLGDDIVEAVSGDCVYVPRGIPHTYTNRGPEPARILSIISPADGVELLAELGALTGAELREEDLAKLLARHHTVLVEPLRAWKNGPER